MISEIDYQKCTGCGICFKTCGLDVFRLDTHYVEVAPCGSACPADVDIRTCNYLLQQGRYRDAAEVFMETNPFPAITGRICPHPCESECARNEVDEPVNINALEQFLGDYILEHEIKVPPQRHIHQIAVVGSGPAGLSCAYFLARRGYPVTIFESSSEAGGMLRSAIPDYRLPRSLLNAQVEQLNRMGIEFRFNKTIGRGLDLTLQALFSQNYKAMFLALGAQMSRKIEIEGAHLDGVYWGLEFLKRIKTDKAPHLKGRVLVVGGGDVAIDSALSALRLGAHEVDLACLETEETIPAYSTNVKDALAEGVRFHFAFGPEAILGNAGHVTGMRMVRCKSVYDKDGQFCPIFDRKQVESIQADAIIMAIGQTTDLSQLGEELNVTARGTVDVDPVTFETSKSGVFAAGDVITGPNSAVQAIAGGREAAESIDRYIIGKDLHAKRGTPPKVVENLPGEGIEKVTRVERKYVSPKERLKSFVEYRKGFEIDNVLRESLRCMTCGSKAYIAYDDDCMTCFTCELRCPYDAISVHPFKERLPKTIEYVGGGR